MSSIRERILARPDLQQARADRNIDLLAAGLNEECVATMVPYRASIFDIIAMMENTHILVEFVQAVANGEDKQAYAAEFLTEAGVMAAVPGFVPPMTNRQEVNEAMFNPDGSEK